MHILFILQHPLQLLFRVVEVSFGLKTVGLDGTLVVNSGCQELFLDLSEESLLVIRENLNLYKYQALNLV